MQQLWRELEGYLTVENEILSKGAPPDGPVNVRVTVTNTASTPGPAMPDIQFRDTRDRVHGGGETGGGIVTLPAPPVDAGHRHPLDDSGPTY